MAPRGKRRRGTSRIDAALDAMSPLGFEAVDVRKTVKDLLQVYGGDHGWPFIEECAYKLLIETLIEPQQPQLEDQTHEEEEQQQELLEGSAQQSHEPTEYVPAILDKEVADEHVISRGDVCEQKKFQEERIVDNCLSRSVKDANTQAIVRHVPTSPRHSLPCMEQLPTKRSAPCYGWISDDDEEEEDTNNGVFAERTNSVENTDPQEKLGQAPASPKDTLPPPAPVFDLPTNPPPVDNLPSKPRSKFHGWIGDDDANKADNLIVLTPAILMDSN